MLAHATQDARQVELFTYPVCRSAAPPGCPRARRDVLRFAPRPALAIAEETAVSLCSPPTLDRSFKVTDFLVVADIEAMDPRVRQSLMSAQRRDGRSS